MLFLLLGTLLSCAAYRIPGDLLLYELLPRMPQQYVCALYLVSKPVNSLLAPVLAPILHARSKKTCNAKKFWPTLQVSVGQAVSPGCVDFLAKHAKRFPSIHFESGIKALLV